MSSTAIGVAAGGGAKVSVDPALAQRCIEAGMKMPTLRAVLTYTGGKASPKKKATSREYTIHLSVAYDEMPEECQEDFLRAGLAKFQLKDRSEPRRWRYMNRYWSNAFTGGNGGGTGGTFQTAFRGESDYSKRRLFYPPGRARFIFENRVMSTKVVKVPYRESYKNKRPILAKKRVLMPIKVRRAGG